MQNFETWDGFLGYRGVRLYVEACICRTRRLAPLGAFSRGWRLFKEAWHLCTEACTSIHTRAPLS